jgi:Spy/CpxP family protein refolding chaperone
MNLACAPEAAKREITSGCADLWGTGGNRIKHQRHLANDHVLQRGRRAAIRDVRDERTCKAFEQLHREVIRHAITARGAIELAGALPL